MAITLVQSKVASGFANNIVVLDDPPTEGNLLVLQVANRSSDTFGVLIDGWAEAERVTDGDIAGVFYHTVGAGESATVDFISLVGNRNRMVLTEWSDVFAYDTSDVMTDQFAASSGSVEVTPSAGVEALLLSSFMATLNTGAGAFEPDGDYTAIDEGASGPTGPSMLSQYLVVPTTSGSYEATCTVNDPFHEEHSAGILVAFSGEAPEPPPDPEPGVFTDEGVELTDVMHWVIQRGGSAEVTGGAQIGTATITCQNTNNQYDPENPSGILYPDLRDGLGIWIGINDDGHSTGTDPAGLFAGRVKDITLIPSPGAAEPATVEFVCEDALGWYGRTPINVAATEGRSQENMRTAALQAAGETRYDLAHEITTLQLAGAEGSLLSVLENINRSNGTRHFIKPATNFTDWYAYTTRNRQWRLDGTVDASVDAGSDHAQIDGWRFSADTVTNQQKATTTPIRFTPATVEVWKLKQQSVGISGRHKFDTWIDFDDYVRSPTVDVHYSGNTPTITLTSFGNRAHLVMQNTNIGHSTRFDKVTIEGALARRLPDESYVANDTDSQALPRGIRSGSDISGEYVGILPSAKGIAEHVVWRYSEVQLRPTVTVQNWFPEMFTLDLYDLISFSSTHLDVTSRLFEIVGLTHEGNVATPASPGPVHHVTTYVLQECRVQSDPGWFTLDSSQLDHADVLAY